MGAAGAEGGGADFREHEIAREMAGEADPFGDAGKEGGERGTEGVRQDVRHFKIFRADGFQEGAEALAGGRKGKDAVRQGAHGPKGGEAGLGQEHDFGVGPVVAKGLEGGHGHDGVAEPIDAADEDAGGGVQFNVQYLISDIQYPISNFQSSSGGGERGWGGVQI